MARLLVHVITGTADPTRAALGLFVARAALEEGHAVDVFVAGDGVVWLRPETREAATGVGTGSIAEHWAALVAGGARLFGSGLSSKARGVTPPDGVEMGSPARLVQLTFEADRVLTY